VRLADGLAAIEPGDAISAISVCGMGGETIRDILDSGKACLTGQERLILQPNGGEQPLRQWLMDNGYRILVEELLRENRFYYEIIVAERAEPRVYSAEELYFGPLHLQARSPDFLAKWQRLLRQKQKTLAGFEQAAGRYRRPRCKRSPGKCSGSPRCWRDRSGLIEPTRYAVVPDAECFRPIFAHGTRFSGVAPPVQGGALCGPYLA